MDTQRTAGTALLYWTSIVAAALALSASAVLFVDYAGPAPKFCAPDGGCGVVRETAWAYPFGIPLPVFGVLGLLAVAITGLIPGRRARIAHVALACAGALLGATLLLVQLNMQALCPYCVVVDSASILLAVTAVVRAVRATPVPLRAAPLAGAGGLLVAAIVVPIALGLARKPALPQVVQREIDNAPAGHATVVDFVDFECPFCRDTHAALAPLLRERRDRVHVARKQVPLPMHRHALDAARAACCGESLGKAEEMADALFAAAPSALTPEGCERIAAAQGLDVSRFRACTRDPATDARIHADAAAFRATQGRGLPTLWIGGRLLEGRQDRDSLRRALDEAIEAL
ncbi:MAG TPA: thioredoxin domain-containing protein [Polyangiales bacterium]|nr:thioredoxin domain-containing protein [Polyangiales bacterium]